TNSPYSTSAVTAANASCGGENSGPGVVVVNVGTTMPRVDRVATVASAAPAPSALKETTDAPRVPTRIDSPTIPLHAMITAANTAATPVRGPGFRPAPPPPIISVTIKAPSMTVTATARTREP